MAVCLAGGLMLNISARAGETVPPNNPYGPIVARNVFGLNPPGPVAPPDPGEPPPKITPNGIMSIFGQLQVLFKVTPKAGQPGAKEDSYVLSEGQGQDDIEVTHIDEKAGMITFNNHGVVQEIPLANAPALNTPVPAPAGLPAPTPGGFLPRFGGGKIGGGSAMNPGRPQPGYHANQNGPRLSSDEQELMIVANKLKAQQEGDPSLPIFPPTSLDGPAGVPSNTAPGPTP